MICKNFQEGVTNLFSGFRSFPGILRVTAARQLGLERNSKRTQYKTLFSQPLGSLWHHVVHGHFLLHLTRQGAMDTA